MEWKTKDSAPTDGTFFLAYDIEAEEIFNPYEIAYCYDGDFRAIDFCELKNFTHWMPLPDGPVIK